MKSIKTLIIMISLILISGCSSSTTSDLLVAECSDEAYVIDTSDYIIDGIIEKTDVEQIEGNSGKKIFTVIDFSINEYIKGSPIENNKIQISIEGGCIRLQCERVEDVLSIDKNDEGKKKRFYLVEKDGELSIHGCGGIADISSEQDVPNLFVYPADANVEPPFDDFPPHIEHHKVEVKLDLLNDESIDTINLNLYDGNNYIVKKKNLIKRGINDYTWQGELISGGNTITIVVNGEAIAGSIPVIGSNKFAYSIGHPPQGQGSFTILTKIDPSKYPPD
jgi:hypothetical protein